MKKITLILTIALAASAALFTSCNDDDKSDCTAGGGGEVTLVLKPQHHGDPIYNQPGYPDSAFIAYNETEFPGDNAASYDVISTGITGTDNVTVSGLKCGKYYVFMTGFDTSIVQRVKGGIPINITQTSGTVNMIIPITED